MPVGALCAVCGVCLGGLLGVALRGVIGPELREKLPMCFGITSISSGILSVIRASQMPVVTLAVVLGSWLGLGMHLERRLKGGFARVLRRIPLPEGFEMEEFITVASIFCFSGFGLYGVMVESFSGDSTQILIKAFLDFFTAVLFGGTLGVSVSLIAVPQAAVFAVFFLLGRLVMPLMSEDMVLNFIACGGVMTVAAGLRVARIRMYPLMDMLPALALVIPLTPLWAALGM